MRHPSRQKNPAQLTGVSACRLISKHPWPLGNSKFHVAQIQTLILSMALRIIRVDGDVTKVPLKSAILRGSAGLLCWRRLWRLAQWRLVCFWLKSKSTLKAKSQVQMQVRCVWHVSMLFSFSSGGIDGP
jgi:hypothetical protein